MSSHRFLLRRVWHLAIPTPPAMGYSPTEYAEFTEPPAEMSSHGFLLRRVWHLAIPTPFAMGYSPTEYAEFTEPPAEMFSHGFHRFTQILRVRCSPTEFTEFTEFGSVGMAGMPYPPTSVRIRAHLWESLLCQKFPCVLWESLFSHGFHRFTQMPFGGCTCLKCTNRAIGSIYFVGAAETAAPPGLAAWVWQGCHTLLICEHPCHLWEALLCKRFCVFGAFRGSSFTACSVGAAETAAPPGGVHGSSVQISPPHHLTTTTPISPRTQPSACPPSTVGTTSLPLAAR